jgi:hypothetical protein
MNTSELKEEWEREERFFKKWNDWSVVEPRLKAAIARVLECDSVLLEDRTGERCIAHRLAFYLEDEFRGWHVDCEFNRQGEEGDRSTKRVSTSAGLPESRAGQGSVDVTPDIIVHLRRKKRNLLAVEVKPSDSAEIPKDREKLRKYLTDFHLRYAFAVLVIYRNGVAAFEPAERITA